MKNLNIRILQIAALAVIASGVLLGVQTFAAGASLGASIGAGIVLTSLMALPMGAAAQGHCLGLVDKKSYLREMKARAALLMPATAERVTAILGEMETNLKPENEKKMTDLIRKSRAGDVEATAQLARLRIVTVDNFMLASTNPAVFFDFVNLEPDEIPYIENVSRQEIVVSYLGQDGRARKTQPIKYQSQAQVDLHTISTEEYEYQLRDIYKGEIKSPSLANIDMARDLELQMSKLMWPFVRAAIGPFNLTGSRQGRVYYPHSIVNVKNLPTSNLLITPGNTTTSLFRKESMDVILKYIAAWGNNAFSDGQLEPVAVYIPSSEVMGFLDQITLTSQPNSKVEEIFKTGFVLFYGGKNWTFIADATLDPDEGRAYVKFNKGIGTGFTKTSMDQTFVDETIGMQKQNKGSVSMNKVVGWGLPLPGRVNVAAVQYHTPR